MSHELALLEAQQDIHEMIAHQVPLEETLEAITSWVGCLLPEALVSIMRYTPERNTLSMVNNSQFSTAYVQSLQDLYVGDGVGTCGTAAFWQQLAITEDILEDPRWDAFRDIAQSEGLRACWSMPILTKGGALLGTFATYYRHPAAPSSDSQTTLKRAASLVALAIVRDRDSQEFHSLSVWHHSLFTNHPDVVCKFGLDGRLQEANPALERITGYSEEQLLGCHFTDLLEARDHTPARAAFEAALAGEAQQHEMLGRDARGHTRHLDVTSFPVSAAEGIVGMYAICHDISWRKRQEADLKLLERGIEASPVGVTMADARQQDMPLVYVNDAFCQMTGYARDQVLGRNCRFLQGEETDTAAIESIRTALETLDSVQITLLNHRQDGTPFWNRLRISPVLDSTGHCTHFIGTQEDITQQREQEARIVYQATHDLLTGLPNRRALESRLEDTFRDSQQRRRLLALMYLDLDGLRGINEGLGHDIGNRLLVAVANRLSVLFGPNDTLARITGDEFAILLPHLKDREAVTILADKVLQLFDAPVEIEGHALYISASIGVACSDDEVHYAQQLIQHADLAMAEAKRQGRNTWQWYTSNVEKTTRHQVLLRHELQVALHQNQLEIYYQPVVEPASGKIRSVEALIRWHHPRHGIVSPGMFIPLAEQTGQIIALGRWVLREACQSLADRLASGEKTYPVAINISSLQFHRVGFLNEVTSILEETGIPATLLELEITESILLRGAQQSISIISELRELGITVALDDFGTGFSSLSYLRDLPIHKVKLDRVFIQDILSSPRNAAIVQGVITMAHHMGLQVVAEGIENSAQRQDLARRHCDLLQGFYFAKPMPLASLLTSPDVLPEPARRQTV